jgi:hypothetical protein
LPLPEAECAAPDAALPAEASAAQALSPEAEAEVESNDSAPACCWVASPLDDSAAPLALDSSPDSPLVQAVPPALILPVWTVHWFRDEPPAHLALDDSPVPALRLQEEPPAASRPDFPQVLPDVPPEY